MGERITEARIDMVQSAHHPESPTWLVITQLRADLAEANAAIRELHSFAIFGIDGKIAPDHAAAIKRAMEGA